MSIARCRASWTSLELDLCLARLRRDESEALLEAGKVFRAAAGSEAAFSEPVASALARVAALEEHERTLAQRLAASLEADRSDYRGASSELGRCLIVARGILDRLVLRDEARRTRRELPRCRAELGARAVEDPSAAGVLPAETRLLVAEARAVLARTHSERAALLAPAGQALPSVLRAALAEELVTFAAFVRRELTKKVFLRLPALAAMAAGWWITRRYTSSSLESSWHRLTGQGRDGLSAETLALLSFWLPVLAAALVAYLAFSLGRRVRRRYLGAESAPSR